MRFEELEHIRKIRALQRLHNRINVELFKGQLSTVSIDICNLNKGEITDAWACYCRESDIGPESIYFSHEFIDLVAAQDTQRKQIYFLTVVMLHEMVHQYCAHNGIDDAGHSEEWQRAAAAHGLHSVYKAGEKQGEHLTGAAELLAGMIRIR
ncbi:MAG: hypothetical protein IKO47_14085 [Ruminococcus sp.]|nr:hypothetical protein [Ruminococcus sp.]MBR4628792.1 hypothetical protein [Ruminococcus sp.]